MCVFLIGLNSKLSPAFFPMNRVKELVPGGPSEGKTPEDEPPAFPVDGTSPQNSDLALIKTSNVSPLYICIYVSLQPLNLPCTCILSFITRRHWAFVLPSPKLLPFIYQLRYCYFRFKIPLRSKSMKSYLRYTVQ